jgi:hypothetical protein
VVTLPGPGVYRPVLGGAAGPALRVR